ncbi:hypothetical protein QFC21_001692 [Naganishia friedmannii]|uniref:Uncharacterized protein n=1 Tax=Naganishia friedmannii TaxID=89922 RepID=A0ACC2W0S1_9TREE|nr:hypothetical protein QFC21_001692 [Naganishia friedmannii]
MRDSTVSADSATPSSAAASDVTQDTEAIKASDKLLCNATVKIRRARKYEGGQVEVLHQGICSKGEFNRCELRFEHGAVVLQVMSSQTYQFEWEYEPAQENPAIKITMRQKRRATYRRGIHCKTIYTYPLAFTVTLSKRYTSGPNPLSSLRPLKCDVYNKGKHIKRDFIVTYNNKRTFHVLKPLPERWILNDEGVVYQLESLETDVLSQPSVTKKKSQRWWFSRQRRPHTPSGVEGRKGVQGAEQISKHGEESDSFTDAGASDQPEQHSAETSERGQAV